MKCQNCKLVLLEMAQGGAATRVQEPPGPWGEPCHECGFMLHLVEPELVAVLMRFRANGPVPHAERLENTLDRVLCQGLDHFAVKYDVKGIREHLAALRLIAADELV